MKKTIVFAVVAALAAFTGQVALGNVIVAITDNVGDPGSVVVAPGDSFEVTVELCTDESLVSGQLMIQADVADIFTLTAVAFDGVVWSNSPDDMIVPTLPELLSPTSSDIGTLAVDVDNGTGCGTMDFATLTLSVDVGAPPSTYYLNVVDMIFGNTNYEEASASACPAYEVIVPEPATLLLLGVPLAMLGRSRKRG